MSKSLQDQLLALGLAQKSAAKKQNTRRNHPTATTKDKSHQKRVLKPGDSAGRNSKTGTPEVKDKHAAQAELSLAQAFRLREKHTKEQAEQARQRKQLEDRRRRQLNKEIRALVEPHRLNESAAEITRNFIYKGRIRKVNVTAEQFNALNDGKLGLVYLAGGYHILTPEHVAQVRVISAENVPDLSGGIEEDDQHPVPDDLIW